jgi:hypothetical protein
MRYELSDHEWSVIRLMQVWKRLRKSALGQTFASQKSHVCFTPESGHVRCNLGCPLRARSGHTV